MRVFSERPLLARAAPSALATSEHAGPYEGSSWDVHMVPRATTIAPPESRFSRRRAYAAAFSPKRW
jgi:hypothetical protein